MDKRYMGIDYGTKRVGIALSSSLGLAENEAREGGVLALPYGVLENDRKLLGRVSDIIKENSVSCVVVGESRGYHGELNPLMRDIEEFKKQIEQAAGVSVLYEPEFYTSAQAARLPTRATRTPANPRRTTKRPIKNDAAAATIILQSYLDKQRIA